MREEAHSWEGGESTGIEDAFKRSVDCEFREPWIVLRYSHRGQIPLEKKLNRSAKKKGKSPLWRKKKVTLLRSSGGESLDLGWVFPGRDGTERISERTVHHSDWKITQKRYLSDLTG